MTRLSEAELDRFAELARYGDTCVVFTDQLSDLVDELRERRAAEAQPAGTVKVRIAVAVHADGDWEARGSARWSDEQNMARCTLIGRKSIVTAYVPLPEPPAEVAGSVEVGDVD